jgi:integrase
VGEINDVVHVALNTGMRKGEILGLRWEHVDLDLGMIHVADSKNSESRDIPINDILLEAFEATLRMRTRGLPLSWGVAAGVCPCATSAHFRYAHATVQEMREGPSEPACRSRLQTTSSCAGQKPGW